MNFVLGINKCDTPWQNSLVEWSNGKKEFMKRVDAQKLVDDGRLELVVNKHFNRPWCYKEVGF